MPEPFISRLGEQTFEGFLADGAPSGRAPGILVAHEGGGLTGHAKERAERLAQLGYVAFAFNLFGEVPTTLERAREINLALRADLAELHARCRAGLDALAVHPSVDPGRLAAIGFCFGGFAMLQLARGGAPLKAVIGFHTGFPEPDLELDRNIHAKVLICMGADDPVIAAEARDAYMAGLDAAGVDWQLHIYGGVGHSFTNREIDALGLPGFAYDAAADRRSWEAMRVLLAETLGQDGEEA